MKVARMGFLAFKKGEWWVRVVIKEDDIKAIFGKANLLENLKKSRAEAVKLAPPVITKFQKQIEDARAALAATNGDVEAAKLLLAGKASFPEQPASPPPWDDCKPRYRELERFGPTTGKIETLFVVIPELPPEIAEVMLRKAVAANAKPVPFEEVREAWELTITNPQTRRDMKTRIGVLVGFLGHDNMGKVEKRDISRYEEWLRKARKPNGQPQYADSTIKNYLESARTLFSKAKDSGRLDRSNGRVSDSAG